jgi:hypothetical protein
MLKRSDIKNTPRHKNMQQQQHTKLVSHTQQPTRMDVDDD